MLILRPRLEVERKGMKKSMNLARARLQRALMAKECFASCSQDKAHKIRRFLGVPHARRQTRWLPWGPIPQSWSSGLQNKASPFRMHTSYTCMHKQNESWNRNYTQQHGHYKESLDVIGDNGPKIFVAEKNTKITANTDHKGVDNLH